MSDFRPLKITANFQTGIISDPYLPIDGILHYQVHRERLGEQTITLPGQSTGGAVNHPLPLKKVNAYKRHNSRLWFYAASFAVWPDHAVEGRDYWNKRFDLSLCDLVDWQGRKARLDVSAGRYKSYHMPVFYRAALYVDWYVVGDRAEIERLLQTVFCIGKKCVQGWGAVRKWEVQEWPEDWSIWSGAGRLMRAIPQKEGGTLYGIRPSYWNPRHQFPCQLPPPQPSTP